MGRRMRDNGWLKRAALGLVAGLALVGAGLVLSAPAPQDEAPASGETVVLIHGLGRGNVAMWPLARRLEKAGYRVQRVGYDSLRQTPTQILDEVSRQIDACCLDGGGRVHFVGHSLGGLVIRAYLDTHRVPGLGRTVLVGTPNQGTPLVDRFRDSWWMQLAGPTALSLGTDADSFPKSPGPPHYPLGVIAGVADRGLSAAIPGADDGLVPVASTRVEGMADFVQLHSSHSMLRYNSDVASQVIAFLHDGQFQHGATHAQQAD